MHKIKQKKTAIIIHTKLKFIQGPTIQIIESQKPLDSLQTNTTKLLTKENENIERAV